MSGESDPIHVYTRVEAIADGDLVDVTEAAQEAGFAVPVALTRAAWADCVEWDPEAADRSPMQDEATRLWDVLWMTRMAVRQIKDDAAMALVQLFRVPPVDGAHEAVETHLFAQMGPGDEAEPVLTIMLPEEA
ncbi:DUF6573 family protein [Kribbella sp. NPDC059898]|uniref:DUF6573 family protein n=1 Tax=Kribbella sp. NPDC059898 TaxID=3346995 RepID=UPI00364C0C8C